MAQDTRQVVASPSPPAGGGRAGRSGGFSAAAPRIATPAPSPQGEGEKETGAVFAANRARGQVSLTLAAPNGVTRRTETREEGSLRVRFPGACADAMEAVLVNTAGGIAGGDRFGIDLTLETGARLVLTTASAEKIYRSLGPDACVAVTATLAENAELIWLPQETIMFDRARLMRHVDIAMAPGARLTFAETIVFGRAAMGEAVHDGRFADRWRVRLDGRLIYADNYRLDGAIADRLAEAATANGQSVVGTVLIVPGDDAQVAAVRAAADGFVGEVGISAWNGIALARLCAPDGAALRHDLIVVLTALGHRALPRLWLN